MSETRNKLFEGLRAMKDGLQAGIVEGAKQCGPEASRLTTQGSMELASALFNNHGFVPYGPGQYTPWPVHPLAGAPAATAAESRARTLKHAGKVTQTSRKQGLSHERQSGPDN